jgi:SAM-dependent methyltransferase
LAATSAMPAPIVPDPTIPTRFTVMADRLLTGNVAAPMPSDHALFAALYDRVTAPSERAGLSDRRRRLLADASGRVLELGGGTGLNLPHYPAGLEQVVVLEPDGAMRERLLTRVPSAPAPVEVHEAGIEDATFPDGSFDTVVSTLTLCTVPDLDAALATVRRVLKPGGHLLFIEHVRARGLQGVAQRVSAPVWTRMAAGCHPDRDILGAMRTNGLAVTDCDRFRIRLTPNPIINWAVQGVAK